MKYLEEKEIIDSIKYYINNSIYKYAVLIDGEWGSGKTFFVREELIPKLEDEGKKVIYISLNGVKSVEEISKQLYAKLVILKVKKNKILRKINFESTKMKILNSSIKIIGDIASNFVPIKTDKNNLEDLYKNIVSNMEGYILIFDDLERCTVNIVETIGYINSFVEYDNIKTIIIANEKEISQRISAENLELKYLLALQKDIDFPQKKKRSFEDQLFNDKNSTAEKKLSIEELRDRTDQLFGNDFSYLKIKEKLIGVTIYYRPDLNKIVNAIINKSVKSSNVKKVVIKNIDFIIKLITDKNYFNFRTLQFAFEKYMIFYKVISQLKLNAEDKENVLNDVLKVCLVFSFDYKNNINILEMNNDYQYTSYKVNIKNDLGYFIKKFSFILNEIMYSVLDENSMKESLESYIKELNESEKINVQPDDPITILQRWNILEDQEVNNNIDKIIKKLEDDNYSFAKYPSIIMTFVNLASIGFDPGMVNKCLKFMIKNIQDHKEQIKIEFNAFGLSAINQDALNKYNENINILKKEIDNIENKNRITEIKTIFIDTNWGKKFLDYCESKHDEFVSKKGFFKLLDVEQMITKIKSANAENIINFKFGIDSVYSFSNLSDFYKDDLENLNIFKEKLNKINTTKYSLTKKYNLDVLMKKIESTINLIDDKKEKKDKK